MGATVTSILPRLHEHYNNDTAIEIYYTSSKDVNPMLAAMDAIADTGEGYGRQLVVPITYGHPTSTGADGLTKLLAKAQGTTAGSATIDDRWTINPITIDGVARWDRDAMDAVESRGVKETFKVMTAQMDGCIESIRKQLATYCFGAGHGALAQILTVSSTGFTVAADLINRFHEGMDVSTCTTTTGAVKNSGGTPNLLVTGVDFLNASGTGTVYTSTDPTDSSGRTAQAINDYVFNYNDRPNAGMAAYANYILPWGAAAWLPGATVTDSTAFCGITRDGKSKLAGLTFACGSLDPENAFLGALRLLFTTGGTKADMLICNPEDYDSFIAQKDKSKTVQISLGKYELGYDGFNIHSLAGTVPVVPDAFCPKGEFYAGPFKNREWAPKLVYLKKLVQIDDKDGQMFVRSATAKAYEMRMYHRGNIVFPAPGRFIRGTGLTIS